MLGALAVGAISALLPWALSFSAGAMVAVSCAELIPGCCAEGKTLATGYKTDVFVDVAEEVLAAIRGQEQGDAAYERRKFRHKAHYSLNRDDGIENDAINRPLTPEEILEQKQLREEVYAALMKLPAIQARRIYARFYLGMTVAEIAQIEGTDRRRVWDSIRRGLKKLARLLDAAR